MPLEKIADAPPYCVHPEHNPPNNICLDPGRYRWTCPACGKVVEFVVASYTCGGTALTQAVFTARGPRCSR